MSNYYETSEQVDLTYFNKFMEVLHRAYVQVCIPNLTGCNYYPTKPMTTFDLLTMNVSDGTVATLEFKCRDACKKDSRGKTIDDYTSLYIEEKKFERRLQEWEDYRCPSMYVNFIEHCDSDGWKDVYIHFTHNYPEQPQLATIKIYDKGAGEHKTVNRYLLLKKYALHFVYNEETEVYDITLPSGTNFKTNDNVLTITNLDAALKNMPEIDNYTLGKIRRKQNEKTKNFN